MAYERNEDIGNMSIYFFSKSGASIWEKKIDKLTEYDVEKELNRISICTKINLFTNLLD